MSSRKIPSLNEALRESNSVPDCVCNQINLLERRNVLKYSIFANQLRNYYAYITDRKLLSIQRNHFNSFYDEIDLVYPHLLFRIEGRRKSFISAYKKLWTSPSDSILKDIAAFRITLFGGGNNLELVESCYSVAEHLIQFSVKNGFLPSIASKPKDTNGFDSKNYPEIIVPQNSLISSEMRQYVKDYILQPKNNGYQSLHVIFMDKEGHYFEVQIRTFFMHIIADSGHASHSDYKKKYGDLDIDYSIINIPGYSYESKKDWVGFEESIEILRRQKTY